MMKNFILLNLILNDKEALKKHFHLINFFSKIAIILFMQTEHRNFINNLKKFRNLRNITQEKLAEMCDVAVGTIGNIECALTKPSFDLLVNIAYSLDVSVGDLFQTPEESKEKEKFSPEQVSILREKLKDAKVTFNEVIDSALDKITYNSISHSKRE